MGFHGPPPRTHGFPWAPMGWVLGNPIPASQPLRIPSNPAGPKFWAQDKKGFSGAGKAASESVPRWYTTTVDYAACTPSVVRVKAGDYPDGDKTDTNQAASMDHSWEKGWLKLFFSSIIDDNAPKLASLTDEGDRKMNCADFNNYIFDSGTQNLILDVFNGLPSKDLLNLDYIGMTKHLNGDCKAAVSNSERHLRTAVPREIALDVTGPDIKTAIDNMNKKFAMLEKIRLGVHMTNLDENKRLADKTNNRLHSLIQGLDKSLASKYPNVIPFHEENWFFTRQFQSFMDNLVTDSPGNIRGEVKGYAYQLIDDITLKMNTLAARTSELDDKVPGEWRDLQTKWSYYKVLGPETWDVRLSWSWGCGRKRDGTPQVCELPPQSSKTSVTPSTASGGSPSTTQNTDIESTITSISSSTASKESPSTTKNINATSTSAKPSQTSSSVSTTLSSASTSQGPNGTTSSFVTSTRTTSCTYIKPTLTGAGPYCVYYGGPKVQDKCDCDDGKTYAPYKGGDECQPICPLTSPADGYSEMQPPPTTTAFQPFTTTDVVGNVQVCTSTSKHADGIPGTACLGPTIHTEVPDLSPTPTPTPTPTPITPRADCRVALDFAWYDVTIITNDWVTDNGERLKAEERGCGLMKDWKVKQIQWRADDGSWTATQQMTFTLPWTIAGGCVERAIASAGGPSGLQCINE
ncbi:hypothetical protein F4802DRAFT_170814 [Xylaria palmicola]|nr:hypothetical protein F4802DRAFT_170814 [Xylaria palmicola]